MDEAYDSLETNIEQLAKYYKSNYDNVNIPITLYKAYGTLIEKYFYKYNEMKLLSEKEYLNLRKITETNLFEILSKLVSSKDSLNIDVLRLSYTFNPRQLYTLKLPQTTIDSVDNKKNECLMKILNHSDAVLMDTLSFLAFSNSNKMNKKESIAICKSIHKINSDNHHYTTVFEMISDECNKCMK